MSDQPSTGGSTPASRRHRGPPAGRPPVASPSARAGVTKAQARAQETYERLQAARPNNNVVDAGFEIYERDLGAGGGVLAGALAFRLFIFAVPYVWVVITVFGSVADLQNESGQDAARSAGLTGLIGKSIADAQRQTESTKILSILVGVCRALPRAAGSGEDAARGARAGLAGPADPAPATRHAAAGLLIGIVGATSAIVSLVGKMRHDRPLIGFVLGLSAIVVWAGAWLVVSWLLPHAKSVTWRRPGSRLPARSAWSSGSCTC